MLLDTSGLPERLMTQRLGIAITQLLIAVALVAGSSFAGYNAYRLYFVKPVLWVNGVGLPLTAVTPQLESAFALVQRDIPDVSSSMQEQVTVRRWQAGLLALLSACLLGGALLAVRS